MKIKFDNNSVSGVNRKYRGFVLDIPCHSSQEIDVPPQYVKDVLSYLNYRHPAVVCTPVEGKTEAVQQQSEAEPATNQKEEPTTGEAGEAESDAEAGKETAGSDNTDEGVGTGSQEGQGETEAKDVAPKAKPGSAAKEAGKGDKKKIKKSGGKK